MDSYYLKLAEYVTHINNLLFSLLMFLYETETERRNVLGNSTEEIGCCNCELWTIRWPSRISSVSGVLLHETVLVGRALDNRIQLLRISDENSRAWSVISQEIPAFAFSRTSDFIDKGYGDLIFEALMKFRITRPGLRVPNRSKSYIHSWIF